MNTTEQQGAGYINPLTGIRAIAAFMVFMVHYNPFEKGTFVHSFFAQFYTGVSIFFVLSGFLITYRYYGKYQLHRKWFLQYFQNRVARIYPLYFLLTTATFAVGLITELRTDHNLFTSKQIIVNSGWVYFTNITFIRGFFDQLKFTLIPQGWSLTVEEVFYLSAPIIWLLTGKKLKLLYQSAILLAIGYALVWVGHHIHFYGFFASDTFMLKFTFFGRSVQFFAGVWLAFIILKKGVTIRFPGAINKTYAGLIISVLCLVGMTFSWLYHFDYLTIFIDNVLLAGGMALLLWGLITEKTAVSWFLSTKVMDLLGKSSYAFYLVHVGIFHQLIETYLTDNILIEFVLFNLISIALYKWVETPLMVWIKSKKW